MKKVRIFFSDWIAVVILVVVLILAFIIRIYRINDLLGFYYDQGRDALVIWKLWHEGKMFLIGPVTGLSGIFLGPFYYYLITPLYLIGRGNPLYPSVFFGVLSTLSLYVIYILGSNMHSRSTGIIASIIGGFSYYIVYNSRWLSNPNPMLLISMLFLYSLWKIITVGKGKWWVISALLLGVSLQFESASAFFYLFVYIIFLIWRLLNTISVGKLIRTNWIAAFIKKNFKVILISFFAFFITLIPQLLFNFRHDNILLNNFLKLFIHEKAFSKPITVFILETRIDYFWSAFMGKIFIGQNRYAIIFASLSLASLIIGKNRLPKGLPTLFAIFIITPMVGYILFQGNFGNIYDYYLIGYFLPFILIFSIGLSEFARSFIGKLFLIGFFIIFFRINLDPLGGIVKNSMDGPTDVKFGSQLKAVNWVFDNAAGRGVYNIDVYVPPVIPYAYDYLFLWQGTVRCGESLCGQVTYQTTILYTLFEQDPPNPQRLQAWMDRQKGIAIVEEETRFGGITIQRRRRI